MGDKKVYVFVKILISNWISNKFPEYRVVYEKKDASILKTNQSKCTNVKKDGNKNHNHL